MITDAEVREHMGLTSPDVALNHTVERATAATNALIMDRCIDFPDVWPPEVVYAALLQASRLVKRRASPEGVAGMGDFGPVRISVMDPDIEAMLSPWLRLVFS